MPASHLVTDMRLHIVGNVEHVATPHVELMNGGRQFFGKFVLERTDVASRSQRDPGAVLLLRSDEDDVLVEVHLVPWLVEEGGCVLEDAHGAFTLNDELDEQDVHVGPHIHDNLQQKATVVDSA